LDLQYETSAKPGATLGALASSRRIVEETTTRRQDAGAPGKFCRGLISKIDLSLVTSAANKFYPLLAEQPASAL
jgi:hypothetical protein